MRRTQQIIRAVRRIDTGKRVTFRLTVDVEMKELHEVSKLILVESVNRQVQIYGEELPIVVPIYTNLTLEEVVDSIGDAQVGQFLTLPPKYFQTLSHTNISRSIKVIKFFLK